jgi:hypothetical protein
VAEVLVVDHYQQVLEVRVDLVQQGVLLLLVLMPLLIEVEAVAEVVSLVEQLVFQVLVVQEW